MLKNIIAPLQNWLLEMNRCVGCGMPLGKGDKKQNKKGETVVTCKCSRIYIQNSDNTYRRALLTEVK